ncbi:MAG: serine hydrolase [Porphyrobacter sp.]|nr:serine hydrolase [Porphyrobacter sp.]
MRPMRLPSPILALACLCAATAPVQAQDEGEEVTDALIVVWGGGAPESVRAKAIRNFAFKRGFKGEIAIDAGNRVITMGLSPDMRREGYVPVPGKAAIWPFASLTKQMLAARLLPELKNMGLTLDTPVSRILPRWPRGPAAPTVRQLLQHRSGLRNPEDTPVGANGWPAFYNAPDKHGLGWCMTGRAAPPATGWRYNNCDYIVLGAVLEEVSLEKVEYMLGPPRTSDSEDDETRYSRLTMITPKNAESFYAMKSPEREVIPAYGASGALGGTLMDVIFFNWGQMRAYKAGRPEMKPMWQGDPELGYMALGQWVFDVQPPGCPDPVKVAERRGAIGQYRLHNIMLPDLGRSMVFATIEPNFEFGEIWQGEGFMAQAVAMLACGEGKE